MRIQASATIDGTLTTGTGQTAITDIAGYVNNAATKGGISSATRTASVVLVTSDTFAPFDCTSGNLTATLPVASTFTGPHLTVKKVDATGNTLMLAGNGTDTIDGYNTITLLYQYVAVTVYRRSDGTGWYIG